MNISTLHPAMPTGFSPSAVPAVQPTPLLLFRRISVRTAIWSLLLGVALVCPALLLISLLPIESITPHRVLNIAQHFPLVILASVLVGPLLEEVIFRGAIIQLGRRYLPLAVPVMGSILLFAAIHFPKGPGVVLLAAPLGALLTWMVLRSGSLWPGLICHAAFNMTAFILTAAFGFLEQAMVLPAGVSPSTIIQALLPSNWLAASLVLAVIAAVMLRRDFARRLTETYPKKLLLPARRVGRVVPTSRSGARLIQRMNTCRCARSALPAEASHHWVTLNKS